MNIYNEISIVIASIAGWIASKKWIFPYIIKMWKWLKERKKENDKNNIDASKELTQIKEDQNNVYENQIDFLVNQLNTLENQLANYQIQLEKMRAKILELNSSIYSQSLTIGKLKSFSCCKADCPYRQLCDENNLQEKNNEDESKS